MRGRTREREVLSAMYDDLSIGVSLQADDINVSTFCAYSSNAPPTSSQAAS